MAKKISEDFFDDMVSNLKDPGSYGKPSKAATPEKNIGVWHVVAAVIILALIVFAVIMTVRKRAVPDEEKKNLAELIGNLKTEQSATDDISGSQNENDSSDPWPDDSYYDEVSDEYGTDYVPGHTDDMWTSDINEDQGRDILFYVVVNASDGGCNLRTGPGVEYDKLQNQLIPNGVQLGIVETGKSSTGKTWGYTRFNDMDGWVALSQTDYDCD